MQVADKGIEAHHLDRAGDLAGKQRIPKTEQGIHRFGWWALDPTRKGPLLLVGDQLAKAAKVGRAPCSFHPQNGSQWCPEETQEPGLTNQQEGLLVGDVG